MKANYLFYFCDGIGSVFNSQVLELLNTISEKKVFNTVFLFLGIKNELQKTELKTRNISAEIKIVIYKSYPNYPFFNFIQRKIISEAINSTNINFDEIIFHTRGELIAWHLSKVLNKEFYKNIIPDVRGASVEEVSEFFKLNNFFKILKICNYKTALKNLNKFSRVTAVSNSLRDYLVNKYKVVSDKIVVTPSLSGSNFRFNPGQLSATRSELNVKVDEILIVFSSGSIANWQNNIALQILAEEGFKVLNLSKKEIQQKNVINKFVSYSEMPTYLNAADAAIIWRDKSIVNNVASPVKFSEYICCGLPVISNYSVDMIKEYVIINSCGLIINSLDDINLNDMVQLKQMDRKKISEAGILKFGIERIVQDYLRIYSSINKI